MKKIALAELANLKSGFAFRTSLEHDNEGDTGVIQIRDTRDTRQINLREIIRIKWDGQSEALLKAGDILIAARGEHNRAILFDEKDRVVATSQFLVLKNKKESDILPEFLCWQLNQEKIQNMIKERRTGATMPQITKEALGALEICLPSMDIQQKIVEIDTLAERETELLEQLKENSKKRAKGIIQKIMERVQ